jgi:hypothetical protein
MPLPFGRIAAVACLCLTFARAAGAAPSQPAYSALATGIDKVCTPATAGTTTRSVAYLIRLADETGAFGPWQPSSPALEEHVEARTDFHGDEFATVREGAAIFTASVAHHSTVTPRTRTDAWCFIGGQLSRATADTIDPDASQEWRHTQYFDRDADVPAHDLIQTVDLTGHDGQGAVPPADAITIARYRTPADLPFYGAYESATGKLSKPKP